MTHDPYYIVKSELDQAVNSISVLLTKLKDLKSTKTDEYMWTVGEIRSAIDEVELDLRDLSDTIYVAEQSPGRFKISAIELDNRRSYITKTRAFVKDVKTSLIQAESLPAIDRPKSNIIPPSLKSKQTNKYTKLQDTLDTDNTSFIHDHEQQQQMIIRDQDQGLDQLHKSVKTLGQIGITINEELDTQHKLLDELGSDVDNTSSRMKKAQNRVTHLLKDTSTKSECICILVLFIILIGIIAFIIYDIQS